MRQRSPPIRTHAYLGVPTNPDAQVNLDTGYSPTLGQSWTVIEGGTISGSFSSETTPTPPSGQIYRVFSDTDSVVVRLTCLADLDGNGVLNFFDVTVFLNYYNSNDPRADLNGDGVLNFFDVTILLTQLNNSCQ